MLTKIEYQLCKIKAFDRNAIPRGISACYFSILFIESRGFGTSLTAHYISHFTYYNILTNSNMGRSIKNMGRSINISKIHKKYRGK